MTNPSRRRRRDLSWAEDVYDWKPRPPHVPRSKLDLAFEAMSTHGRWLHVALWYAEDDTVDMDATVEEALWADQHGLAELLYRDARPGARMPFTPFAEQATEYRALKAAHQELSPTAWDTAVVSLRDGMTLADAVAAARALT